MSDFIVSARKYRPATFRSVVGQKHITSTLQNAIERGQLAHAYLFCGPRGVGKTTCARIFAKAINCLAPHGAEACNECESCRSFNEGRSLNIHEPGRRVEQLRGGHPHAHRTSAHHPAGGPLLGVHHRRGPHALGRGLQRLPQDARRAARTRDLHPRHHRKTQDHPHDPLALPDLRLQPHPCRGFGGIPRYIASEEGVAADEESLNLIAQKADGGMRDALSMFDKAVSFCGTTLDYRNVAQTLNVLDYDTYFGVTEMLLRGDYAEALVTFDAVLSKGFSGQTFMAGLNRHMRDLLMAERPETLRLIEMTGTLLERYRTQAGACSVEFLFGAISVLTELDGKIRQSSNQRLLVELGLMKIAGLGQKKNDLLTPSGEYPLPELTPRTAAPAARAETQPAPPPLPPARKAQLTPQGSGRNLPRRRKARVPNLRAVRRRPRNRPRHPECVRTETFRPRQLPRWHPERPRRHAPARPHRSARRFRRRTPAPAAAPQPVPQPEARPAGTARRPLISGTSLSDLLASAGNPAAQSEKTQDPEPAAATVDPECAAKLERARERILALIRERRPRFVPAFEQMLFRGDTIAVSVPTTEPARRDPAQQDRNAHADRRAGRSDGTDRAWRSRSMNRYGPRARSDSRTG